MQTNVKKALEIIGTIVVGLVILKLISMLLLSFSTGLFLVAAQGLRIAVIVLIVYLIVQVARKP